jgi:hypothetical protein
MRTPQQPVGDFVTVFLSPSLAQALERYIAKEVPGKNRSQALRNAFQEWCVDKGYVQRNEADPGGS